MSRFLRIVLGVAAVACVESSATGQTVQSVRVGTGFTTPIFATTAPGSPDLLYVVEQGGTIRTLNPGTGAVGATPFLNISSLPGTNFAPGSGNERGLLGLAFHPNFQNNGYMYVNYTATSPTTDFVTRVDRFTVSGGTVDTSSRQTVIEAAHPGDGAHNGGWIGFNPANGSTGSNSGNLYIAIGDGGGAYDPPNNAQNTNVLMGKILRIDVNNPSGGNNYGIPTGNMSGAGVRPEIYSYGLRNPHRASFDRANGNLYIGDVGQQTREEVNFIANGSPGGQNFGWRLREGSIQTPNAVGGPAPSDYVAPIYDYGRDQGRTVIGGYVYRGPNTAMQGQYFFSDFGGNKYWSFKYDGSTITEFTDRTSQLITATNGDVLDLPGSYAEDGNGNLFILTYDQGNIYQITPVPEPASLGLTATAVLIASAGWRRRNQSRKSK